MFENFPKSQLRIISNSGDYEEEVSGIVSNNEIIIDNISVKVEIGYEIRRMLPNGKEETFRIEDYNYNEKFHGIPAHFQIKTSKIGSFPPKTGGVYNLNVSGGHARINISSVDQSTNTYVDTKFFIELRAVAEGSLADSPDVEPIRQAITKMEAATGRDQRLSAYQEFIAAAANHMTLFAPFLATLGQWLQA